MIVPASLRVATLSGCLLMPVSTGLLNRRFTVPNLPWYRELKKPFFNPPESAFRPAWIALLSLNGVSLFRILDTAAATGADPAAAVSAFVLQFTLNALWPAVFFGAKDLLASGVVSTFLLGAIANTAKLFYAIDPVAAYALTPYFLWCSLATTLNFTLWWWN